MRALFVLIRRDLRLALRQGADTLMVLAFFVLAVVLFPFGVGPELNVLARIAGGVLWATALLASMLSLDRMFQADYEDGSLDLMLMSPAPLEMVVLGKVIAHWLTTGLPLVIMAPLLGVLMNLADEAYGVLILSMLLGTPTLSLIGSLGAALVLGARRGGVLLSLLILPMYIPILIFGAGAIENLSSAAGPAGALQVLAGGFFLALIVCLIFTPMALRQTQQ
ncbi:MAG: heme exporter protein CcmB [Alphaproteobacteria bacterium RIFOXYD12_FULL_60_8]|nr:MAG: heme exporter protein CcmB [Alphaproteobacteria bacterium RIFOXYD12_FULL_60_8]